MPKLEIEDKKPWEQQPGEPNQAYAAFIIYRDTPTHERSINKAYETYLLSETKNGDKHVKTVRAAMWTQYSGAYGWKDRAAAFDVWKRETISKLRLEKELEMMSEIKTDTIEMTHTAIKECLEAYKGEDLQEMANFMRKAPLALTFFGKAGILSGYKALHGEKTEINGSLKIGPMDWKI